jgi:hypothetical protein
MARRLHGKRVPGDRRRTAEKREAYDDLPRMRQQDATGPGERARRAAATADGFALRRAPGPGGCRGHEIPVGAGSKHLSHQVIVRSRKRREARSADLASTP